MHRSHTFLVGAHCAAAAARAECIQVICSVGGLLMRQPVSE